MSPYKILEYSEKLAPLLWETLAGLFRLLPLPSSQVDGERKREVGMSGRQIETGNISSSLAFTLSRHA